jgi:hypothetical protein
VPAPAASPKSRCPRRGTASAPVPLRIINKIAVCLAKHRRIDHHPAYRCQSPSRCMCDSLTEAMLSTGSPAAKAHQTCEGNRPDVHEALPLDDERQQAEDPAGHVVEAPTQDNIHLATKGIVAVKLQRSSLDRHPARRANSALTPASCSSAPTPRAALRPQEPTLPDNVFRCLCPPYASLRTLHIAPRGPLRFPRSPSSAFALRTHPS